MYEYIEKGIYIILVASNGDMVEATCHIKLDVLALIK